MAETKKATSSAWSVQATASDHTAGSRTLDVEEDVWNHNAWYVSLLTQGPR